MLRRIKSAKITAIALCKQGKNGMRTLLKADGAVEFVSLVKAAGENELLSVVYAPERPDDDSDYAEAPVIKEFAHEYLRDHRNLDIEHDGKVLAKSAAYIAESFIVAKGDERFADWRDYNDEPVGDLAGAWATVIKLEDPTLQKAFKNGELDGVSMFGRAAVERVDIKAASKRIAERLGNAHSNTKEIDMNKEELMALFGTFKTEVTTMVKSAIAEATKPVEKPAEKNEAPTAPVFKGSATNPKDLEAFEAELRTFEVQKAIASGSMTADKIAEMRKSLAQTEPTDAEAGVEAEDTPNEKDLKRQLFKARKARNAPEGSGRGDDSEVTVQKANHDEGLAIAKLVNERKGVNGGMKVVNANG